MITRDIINVSDFAELFKHLQVFLIVLAAFFAGWAGWASASEYAVDATMPSFFWVFCMLCMLPLQNKWQTILFGVCLSIILFALLHGARNSIEGLSAKFSPRRFGHTR